jgi:hypothetical protein
MFYAFILYLVTQQQMFPVMNIKTQVVYTGNSQAKHARQTCHTIGINGSYCRDELLSKKLLFAIHHTTGDTFRFQQDSFITSG